MRGHLKVLFAAVALVLIGCATGTGTGSRPDALDAWIGKTQNDLLLDYGPPARYEDDGADGQIMVYEWSRDFITRPVKAAADPFSGDIRVTPGEKLKRINRTLFFVHADHTIYAWRRQYEQVPQVVGE